MVKIFPKWPLLLQLLRVYSNKILLKSSLVAQTIVSAYNVGDLGSIPRSGRSFGEGNGNLLQHCCLENPTDGGAW